MAAAGDPALDHPAGARRAYAVPRRGGGHVISDGEVVGHRTTAKGSFVEVRDASGELRSVRPNCIYHVGAAPDSGPLPAAAAAREPAPVVIQTVRDPLPCWPRGLREDLAAAYVGVSSALLRVELRAGRFPAAVQITAGRIVWLRDDLDAWLDRKAGRAVQDDAAEWLK